MNSKIIQRIEKTTSTGKDVAEIKLQSGRWIQIWSKNFNGSTNPLYTLAEVGKIARFNTELKPIEKRPGIYRMPSDLVIVDEDSVDASEDIQTPEDTQTSASEKDEIAQRIEEKEKRIKEMASRRDHLIERQIVALERTTAAIERLIAVFEAVRPPTLYPDENTEKNINSLTDIKLTNEPKTVYDNLHDEPGY
mgnify:FL=1